MGMFDRPIEEMAQVGASWTPHNEDDEAAATAAMDLPEQLPDLVQGMADMAHQLAAQVDAEVPFSTAARDLISELGNYIHAAVTPIRDAAAGIRSQHQPDFERIENPDLRQDAWDRVRNRRG